MLRILILPFLLIGASGIAQVAGNYELFDNQTSYDTLPSGLVVKRKQIVQKELTIKSNGTFESNHLQPYYGDSLDYTGTWTLDGSALILSYKDYEEDEFGHKELKLQRDIYRREGESLYFSVSQDHQYIYSRVD